MAMRFITVESPPRRLEFGDQVKPSPEADVEHPSPTSGTRPGRPWGEQGVRFAVSVARLPFKALWNADKFYVDYAFPFVKAMLMGRATRSEAKWRKSVCEGCPKRAVAPRDWFAGWQIGVGIVLWGVALFWLVGPWLFFIGWAWAFWSAAPRHGDLTRASFCQACNCGTHGLARLDFKVRRAGSTCPAGLWEKSDVSERMDR